MAAERAGRFSNFSLDDEYSLLANCHEVIHVPLPPSYINTKAQGIKTLLDSWRGQYVQRLDGVLLDYCNLAFVGSSGSILGDQPYIHEDVAADFLVFRPKPGSLFRGHINRMSKKHMGCLVHDRVNVTVLLPQHPAPELLAYLSMGQEVICKMVSVSLYRNGILKLRAQITQECLKIMQESIPVMRTSYEDELEEYESNYGGDSDWNEGGASDAEGAPELCYLDPEEDFTTRHPVLLSGDESAASPSKKKKRKRKGTPPPATDEDSGRGESSAGTPSRKKSRKKQAEEWAVPSSPMSVSKGKVKKTKPGINGALLTSDGSVLGPLGSDGLSAADTVSMSDDSAVPDVPRLKKKKKKRDKDSTSEDSTQSERKKKKKKKEKKASGELSEDFPASPKRKKRLLDLDADAEALLTFQNSISFLRKDKSKTSKHSKHKTTL